MLGGGYLYYLNRNINTLKQKALDEFLCLMLFTSKSSKSAPIVGYRKWNLWLAGSVCDTLKRQRSLSLICMVGTLALNAVLNVTLFFFHLSNRSLPCSAVSFFSPVIQISTFTQIACCPSVQC